jgi:nicotinamide riboside transporter PnuC
LEALKKLSRGLVVGLAVVVALVSYNVNIPAGKSSASNWRFAFTHPTILLHIIAASAVFVLAVILLIRAIRAREAAWIIISVIGVAFIVLAYASGNDYVVTLRKSALNTMSAGWLGAIITYGIGWYFGRKQERGAKA